MEHIVNKYQITTESGEAVTIEQLMDNTELVTMLTDAMGKRSGRKTTSPDQPFNREICKCRIWDAKTGLPKQCPNANLDSDGVCKTHATKIEETEEKQWKFGFFDGELPSFHLSGKDKGKSIAWKVDGYEPKRRSGGSKKVTGQFPRPKGRAPKGKAWNYDVGQWEDSDVLPVVAESWPKKFSELKKMARDVNISEDELDTIDDSSNRRQAMIKFLKSKGVSPPKDTEIPSDPKPSIPAETLTLPDTTPSEEPKAEASAPMIVSIGEVNPPTGDLLSMFEPEPEPEPESEQSSDTQSKEAVVFGENTLTFEGVEYMWDQSDNELTDPETYDQVGKWNPEKKIIEFESDEMVDNHKQHPNNIHNQ